MGRGVASTGLQNHVRELRVARGLAQQAIAERTGLTRQAISAIESGQYVPNTTVALRLARVLECDVEELFSLMPDVSDLADQFGSGTSQPQRLSLAKVGRRWVGYPRADRNEMQLGFAKADAVAQGAGPHAKVEVLAPSEQLEHTAVVFGCDPSLGIVGAHLAARRSSSRLLWISAASQAALDAIGQGEAHVAGTHLPELADNQFNVSHAQQALSEEGGLVVEFARWEQGLAVAPGNPRGIRSVADLARPGLRLVNREEGSGARALLDDLLQREGVPHDQVPGYDRLADSHLTAAMAVASGAADFAISLRAIARAFGLDFVPLAQVRFDFVIPRAHLGHPTVAMVLELLQSRALRTEIGALAGYEVTRMGTVHADWRAA